MARLDTPSFPPRFTLPSGRRVRATLRSAAPRAPSASTIAECFAWLASALELRAGDGSLLPVEELALADGQLVRALAHRAALIAEPEQRSPCHNCGASIAVVPSIAFEAGPYLDDELGDPELDELLDFERAHPIPPIATPLGLARSVRLAPRRVADLGPLAKSRSIRMTPAVVTALGIVAIGRVRRAADIAHALTRASDDAWLAVLDRWERAHYPARLQADVRCASCSARNTFAVPALRELDALAPPVAAEPSSQPAPGFPSHEAFASMVRRHKSEVFARLGVRGLRVVVDEGVPACDDGGEPLLGSYDPLTIDLDGQATGKPEVRLYWRTFVAEHKAGAFDVEAEVRETIEHEVTHHLHHLRGHDPLDAEERAAIARDRARVVGRRELVRREARGMIEDLIGFVRHAWPFLALLALAAVASYGGSCRP